MKQSKNLFWNLASTDNLVGANRLYSKTGASGHNDFFKDLYCLFILRLGDPSGSSRSPMGPITKALRVAIVSDINFHL